MTFCFRYLNDNLKFTQKTIRFIFLENILDNLTRKSQQKSIFDFWSQKSHIRLIWFLTFVILVENKHEKLKMLTVSNLALLLVMVCFLPLHPCKRQSCDSYGIPEVQVVYFYLPRLPCLLMPPSTMVVI